MNPADQAKLFDFLQSRWKDQRCPMCGRDDWAVQTALFALLALHDKRDALAIPPRKPTVSAEDVVPVVPVVCKHCGNTVLVNAIVAKLVEGDGKHA